MTTMTLFGIAIAVHLLMVVLAVKFYQGWRSPNSSLLTSKTYVPFWWILLAVGSCISFGYVACLLKFISLLLKPGSSNANGPIEPMGGPSFFIFLALALLAVGFPFVSYAIKNRPRR